MVWEMIRITSRSKIGATFQINLDLPAFLDCFLRCGLLQLLMLYRVHGHCVPSSGTALSARLKNFAWKNVFFYWHLLMSLDDHWWLFHIVSESFDESHLLFSDLVGSQAPIRRNLAFLSYCCVDVGAAPESSGCFLLSSQGRYRVAVPVPAEAQHVTDFWTLASA